MFLALNASLDSANLSGVQLDLDVTHQQPCFQLCEKAFVSEPKVFFCGIFILRSYKGTQFKKCDTVFSLNILHNMYVAFFPKYSICTSPKPKLRNVWAKLS